MYISFSTDSICFFLEAVITRYLQFAAGDPDAIAKVSGRMDVNYLDNLANKENLQLLNLM